jgi:hypothetical protein
MHACSTTLPNTTKQPRALSVRQAGIGPSCPQTSRLCVDACACACRLWAGLALSDSSSRRRTKAIPNPEGARSSISARTSSSPVRLPRHHTACRGVEGACWVRGGCPLVPCPPPARARAAATPAAGRAPHPRARWSGRGPAASGCGSRATRGVHAAHGNSGWSPKPRPPDPNHFPACPQQPLPTPPPSLVPSREHPYLLPGSAGLTSKYM